MGSGKGIKQVYVPYWEWEDWINGMWRQVDNEDELLHLAISFTGNHILYGNAMKEVVYAWPRTMLNSLTNPSINKRAFVGHCACCYVHGLPEYIVRMAWKELSDKQRELADQAAQNAIDQWIQKYKNGEIKNRGLHIGMGKQMLLYGDTG